MHKLLPSLPETVSLAAAAGKFKLARALMDKLLAGPLLPGMAQRLEFEKDRLERLRKAYPYDRAAALKILRKRLKNFRSSELDGWIQAGYAAPRLIDGREMFMDSFASNIVSCDRNKLVKRIKNPDKSGNASFARLMARVEELAAGAAPARYRARARVTLTLNSAPKEKVRCWLPFPRVGDQVSSARLIAASHKKYKLAKPGAEHRTIYMEGRGRKFFAEFEYEVSEWVPAAGTAGPVPAAARKYLAEEPPHIVFTPYARKLAAEIVGKEKDNYRKARRIYDWLTDNLTYNFTLPYGVFENISDYALTNLRGDCGFMALAFITLCRAAGVPAKWQSGWAARPGQPGRTTGPCSTPAAGARSTSLLAGTGASSRRKDSGAFISGIWTAAAWWPTRSWAPRSGRPRSSGAATPRTTSAAKRKPPPGISTSTRSKPG